MGVVVIGEMQRWRGCRALIVADPVLCLYIGMCVKRIRALMFSIRSFHSLDIPSPSSHSGLATLTNAAQMAPADMEVPSPHVPTESFTTPSQASSTTSDGQHTVIIAKSATQQFVIPQQQTFPEYPNGNMVLQIVAHAADDFMSTGWATHKTSSWKIKSFYSGKARKYKCLGVMVCTTNECSFVVRPHQIQANWAKQLSSGCTTHETPLQHILCNATLTWKEFTKDVLIHSLLHDGHHSHPPPPLSALLHLLWIDFNSKFLTHHQRCQNNCWLDLITLHQLHQSIHLYLILIVWAINVVKY